MGKIYRRLKRALLLATALTLLLSTGIVASAAGNGDALKTLQVTENNKAVKKLTLFTNESARLTADSAELNAQLPSGAQVTRVTAGGAEIRNEAELDVVLKLKATNSAPDANQKFGGYYLVSSNNQRVASVVKTPDGKKIRITAKGNGTASITLKDKNSSKKYVIKVTVKTLAEKFDVTDKLEIGQGGSLSLGTVINPGQSAASLAKLKYTVENPNPTKVASVSGKGVVKGAANKTGSATIRISAQDQTCEYTVGGRNKKAAVGHSRTVAVTVKTRSDLSITKEDSTLKKIDMKTNLTSPAHTYQFEVKAENAVAGVDYTFTSSKPSVATVNEEGWITAVGKGSAKISVVPADGTKLKRAVSINVKVTTDTDSISVPSNVIMVQPGKSAKIGAKALKTASNKKLVYEVLQGKELLNASCLKNGSSTLKGDSVKAGTKEGTVKIRISGTSSMKDGGWEGVPRVVEVKVVKKLETIDVSFCAAEGGVKFDSSGDSRVKKTLYIGEDARKAGYDRCGIDVSITPADIRKEGKLSFTSSKPAVASVDANGNITAKAKGTAKITVKTTDGSNRKKTLTVTVVKPVTGIDIAGAVKTGEDAFKFCVVNPTKNGTITLNAAINADAYKKVAKALTWSYDLTAAGFSGNKNKLKISPQEFVEGETEKSVGTITVTANGDLGPDALKKEIKVTVCVTNGAVASGDSQLGLTLKKGEKYPLQNVSAGTLRWNSTNKSAVSVSNGVLTAKKVTKDGEAVEITAEPGGYKVKVRVTESQADFEKGLNAKVKALVTAEDYTVWTGMKPAFNAKTGTITLTAKNLAKLDYALAPDTPHTAEGLKDAAIDSVREELLAVFTGIKEGVIDKTYTGVVVKASGTEKEWSIILQANGLSVQKDGGEIAVYAAENYEEAVKELAKQMAKDAAGWAGRDLTIELTKTDSGKGVFESEEYRKTYTIHFAPVAMTEADSLIDKVVDGEIGTLNGRNKESVTGIHKVHYVNSSNLTVVDIYDPQKKLEDLIGEGSFAVKERTGIDLEETLNRIAAKVKEADIQVAKASLSVVQGDTAGVIDEILLHGSVQELTNLDLSALIGKEAADAGDLTNASGREILDTIRKALGIKQPVETLGDLDGAMMTVNVSGSFNEMPFTQEYHMIFRVVTDNALREAVDQEQDEKIVTETERVNEICKDTSKPLAGVVYVKEKNEMTVSIRNTEAKALDVLQDDSVGLKSLVKLILAGKDSCEISAEGKFCVIDGSKLDSTAQKMDLADTLGVDENTTLSALIGKTLKIRVPYEEGVLSYTLNFAKAENKEEAAPAADAPETALTQAEEEPAEEERTDDEAAEPAEDERKDEEDAESAADVPVSGADAAPSDGEAVDGEISNGEVSDGEAPGTVSANEAPAPEAAGTPVVSEAA